MLKSVINFFFGFLVLILIIDPGDLILHLKIPLFVIIFIVWILSKTINPIHISKDSVIICFAFLVIPLLGIVSAIIQGEFSEPEFAMGILKSFSIIILMLVVNDLSIPLQKHLLRFSFVIPCIIIPLYLYLVISPNTVVAIMGFLSLKEAAKFSNRDFYGYKVFMLYYRTSPLLVFAVGYYCDQFFNYAGKKLWNFVLASMFLFTLILSGTRANMLAGVAVLLYFLFMYFFKQRNKLPLIIASIVILYVALSFFNTLSFSKRDQSSDVKSGHFSSYKDLFDQHPQYLIWGEGLGSTFYSTGNKINVKQTELTYIELIRWFGIPLTLVLLFLLIYPVIYLKLNSQITKRNKYLIVSYFAYLFIAGTNPLLVSSTGMLVVILMLSFLSNRSFENIETLNIRTPKANF